MHDHLSDDQHDVNADEHGSAFPRRIGTISSRTAKLRSAISSLPRNSKSRSIRRLVSETPFAGQRARHPASASSCFPVAFPGTQARHQIRCLVPIHLRGGSVHHSGGEPQLHRERLFLHPGPGMFGSQRQRLLAPPRQHGSVDAYNQPVHEHRDEPTLRRRGSCIVGAGHHRDDDAADYVENMGIASRCPSPTRPILTSVASSASTGRAATVPICDVVLEMQSSVDNFKLKFVAGRMHSTHDVSDFSLAGGTGNARIPIFRDGRGLIPRGALSFTAQGSTGGTTLVSSDTNADPIHFQLDFKSGMLSVRDAHLTLPGGQSRQAHSACYVRAFCARDPHDILEFR